MGDRQAGDLRTCLVSEPLVQALANEVLSGPGAEIEEAFRPVFRHAAELVDRRFPIAGDSVGLFCKQELDEICGLIRVVGCNLSSQSIHQMFAVGFDQYLASSTHEGEQEVRHPLL